MKAALRQRMTREGTVLVPGHFVLSSGLHSLRYLNKDDVCADPHLVWEMCQLIARDFRQDMVQTVVGPAVGAVRLAFGVAWHLATLRGCLVFNVVADKVADGFAIKRGCGKFIEGRRVLVVEDVLTTGKAAKKVVALIRELGGIVVGVGSLYNRGHVTTSDVGDVPKLTSLISLDIPLWTAADCPLCKRGIPESTQFKK